MSGVKGRSGRKPNYWKVETEELLNKSAYILMDFFKDVTIPKWKKAQVAMALIVKRIPYDVRQQTVNQPPIPNYYDVRIETLKQDIVDKKPQHIDANRISE